ncbi:MAG: phenylalanine--tRNA ligase subunit beta [Candidatus Omnitrophota bacterium]
MKLSYKWLKEYVDVKATPEEVAHALTMSGSEVEVMPEVGSDRVMDLEITSNRPDCLSIIGLAREVSTVFDKDLCLPELAIPENKREKGSKVECVIKAPKLCPRYTARVITGVKVAESDECIKERLSSVGLRMVNNVVDITNYCLMELGQPLHAFDLDKLKGGKIIVREAVKGEKIVTIDGIERKLEPGMLVIADSERPVAIAGIMGGVNTEVSGATKNILLESAYFDPISVRQTARKLGLGSESSYRFERGVDKGMIAGASDRASLIIKKETGGKICEFYDCGKLPAEGRVIKFDVEKAGRLLGIKLREDEVKRIFSRLGMIIDKEAAQVLAVKVPSFREDLTREIDLVEEAARIYGYDNIPETTTKLLAQTERKGKARLVEERIRGILPSLGLSEIMTYSLISEPAADIFSSITKEKTVQLSNPLSEEQKILSPQLLDGMLRMVSYNLNRKNKDLRLYEIGKIYARAGKEFREEPALCMGITGLAREGWKEGERGSDFYDLKGKAEALFRGTGLEPEFAPEVVEGFDLCASMKIAGGKRPSGLLGQVGHDILKKYGIDQKVYVCQIELAGFYEKAVLEDVYRPITRFPASSRDISILCDKPLTAGEISGVIVREGKDIIRRVKLVDVYEGKQVPPDKKSLTFSIEYGLDTRTLKEDEVEQAHSGIKEALSRKLGVSFR